MSRTTHEGGSDIATNPEPLWAVTPEKIQEAVRRIVEAAHPLKVILFGSRARGTADPDSDLDLLIIEREVPDRYAEMVRLDGVLGNMILAVDILVIAERDFEERSQMPGSVYFDVRREGKVLYESV
ncbi:MAG: nucleotidyltransferase domain-containing protein [Gammaproteobacteria bacterium]